MDMNRISSYPDHPEPDGQDAEFNRESRPRSSPWAVATVGVAAFAMVVGFFILLVVDTGAGLGSLLIFGGGSLLFGLAVMLVGFYLMMVVFAPQNAGNTE